MNISRQDKKIVVRDPQVINNGMVITKEAFIELDQQNMRSDFLHYFLHYYERGMIRVKVAHVETAHE